MPLAPLQKLSVTVGASLLVLGFSGAVAYYYSSRLVASDRAVERANANMSAAFSVVIGRQDAERATKAYVVRRDNAARAALQDAQARVEDAFDLIALGTDDNPRQRQLLVELGQRAAASFEAFRTTVLIRDRVDADSARRFLSGDLPASATDSLMKIVGQMRDEELRVLAERTRLQSARGADAQHLILAGMVLAFLLAGAALQPMRAGVATRLSSQIVRAHVANAHGANAPELADDAGARAAGAVAQLQAMHRLVAALASAQDVAAGATALVAAAAPALHAALAAVIVPDGAGGFTVLAASHPAFDRVANDLASPVAEVLRTGKTGMAESRAERERRWGSLAAFDAGAARGAVLFVPMTRDGGTTGVLLAALAADHVFGDDELLFAATLGRLGGPAVAARSRT